jgi:metallo-beta-lactamase class B
VQSAQRFAEIAQQARADVMMSNHTDWDGSKVYLPRLATRAPATQNPYVVGAQGVRRYLDVARECATARLMRLN